MNKNFGGRLFTGLMIIGIGVFFLLKQLGYISIGLGELFATYWPVILLLLGLQQLVSGSFSGAMFFFLIGGIFFVNKMEWMDLSIGDLIPYLIPFIIIFVGLRMIWRPNKKSRKKKTPPSEDWTTFRPYSDRDNVPPAPPLHPDPTGLTGQLDEEPVPHHGGGHHGGEQHGGGHHGSAHHGSGHHGGAGGAGGAGGFMGGFMGHGHAKKERRSCSQSNDGNEHVEWWNYSDPNVQTRSNFIGDIHMGHDYWELKPLNISHFIGDTVLDLTKAEIPYGETRITISSFIGDVKVFVPNHYEVGVQVVSSAFIGDVKILDRKEGGIFTSANVQSPRYSDAEKKIKLVVSTFIGDTRVTKVG